MSARARLAAVLIVIAGCLAAPALASAHAYLVRTDPAASGVLPSSPKTVALTYEEAVEPKFAIISVTDVNAKQQTTGPVRRSAANPDTLVVPLRPNLPEGWYLIYWRAISVDGHPVQGAFTYAVGPNPGPAPQFPVPSVSGSATSKNVLIAKWVMYISTMIAIGLFAFRFFVARPLVRRVRGTSLRPLSLGLVISSVVGLVAIPVYLDFATAIDSLRSVFDVTALVPLFRLTAFGRGYVDMVLCFALFSVAGWLSLWLDNPESEHRSVAALLSQTGAVLAAAAILLIPGTVGHAAQTSPRGFSVAADWLHLVSGSIWLGGLVGLLVLWFSSSAVNRIASLSLVAPRFSKVALASVIVLLGSGTLATIFHMPAVNALWETSYGVAILVKIGILIAAMVMASGNLLRHAPALAEAKTDPDGASGAAGMLRALVSGETFLVVAAVFVAAVLASLAPPPPAFALQNSALARVGPGRVAQTINHAGYKLQVLVSPNKAAAPNSFALEITKNGQPVRGANVTLTFNHLEMHMPQQQYQLSEIRPGVYARSAPALLMVGRWGLNFQITPPSGEPFNALIVDQANG
jgi:copper transport protein